MTCLQSVEAIGLDVPFAVNFDFRVDIVNKFIEVCLCADGDFVLSSNQIGEDQVVDLVLVERYRWAGPVCCGLHPPLFPNDLSRVSL